MSSRRECDSHLGYTNLKKYYSTGRIAQREEHLCEVQGVLGSIPSPTALQLDFKNNIPNISPVSAPELKETLRAIRKDIKPNAHVKHGGPVRDEIIKLVLCKISDEQKKQGETLDFRAEPDENPKVIAARVSNLFISIRQKYVRAGVFKPGEDIELDAHSVTQIVAQLQNINLTETDSDILGDVFEIFADAEQAGSDGMFFTPRNVASVAVKLADPHIGMSVYDPACGSGGFLVAALKHTASLSDISVFGIDKDNFLTKLARANMIVAGCEAENIHQGDSLRLISEKTDKQYDIVLANPPYGAKGKIGSKITAKYGLGKNWKQRGTGQWEKTEETKTRDPYLIFTEQCLKTLKAGCTLCIVLPETAFHAPTLGFFRQYLLDGNNLKAVIDLPHNTFRPHCNAKTCLLVIGKSEPQQNKVIMATPKQCGNDHLGRPVWNKNRSGLWDDLAETLQELEAPESEKNSHVFTIHKSEINADVLIPRYYRGLLTEPVMLDGCRGVRLGDLERRGVISVWDGHGSPKSETKGAGDVPYIRVSDVVNWELYRNPVSGIPESVYAEMIKGKCEPEVEDIIFVRRGSYRIGAVAMVSPRDIGVLLTRELLTIRVDKTNKEGITPYYLLGMISSSEVQHQVENYVFMDTTLPNLHDRWKHLVIPIHDSPEDRAEIGERIRESIEKKWEAQEILDKLEKSISSQFCR